MNMSCCARLAAVRWSTSTSEIVRPRVISRSKLDNAWAIATPSRTWAARIPLSSASFLIPLENTIGEGFEINLEDYGKRMAHRLIKHPGISVFIHSFRVHTKLYRMKGVAGNATAWDLKAFFLLYGVDTLMDRFEASYRCIHLSFGTTLKKA